MSTALLIAIIYVIGFIISLIALFIFKKELDVDDYDPPHSSDYDDYDSNASAYVGFSIAWPLFWAFTLIGWLYGLLIKFSKYIDKKTKK